MKKTPKLRFPEFSGVWNHTFMKNVANGFDYGMNSASKEFDGDNKYIRITDIDDISRKYIKANCVSPDGELEEKYLVGKDDILFTRTGASTGKTYLYNEKDGVLYFAGFLIRAKVTNENNSKFIFLQTLTEKYNKWVKIMSMRSGQPGINSQEYSGYDFYIPDKTEQDKIAKFFSLIDKKIEKQQEKVEALEEYKKEIMQKIFSQEIRFKDENGEEYPKWERKRFGEITNKVGVKNKELGNYEVYSISNKYGFIPQSDQFEDSRLEDLDKSLYQIVNEGEFAYNPARINVGSIGLLKENKQVIVSSLYVCFKLNDNMNNVFFEKYFSYNKFNKDVLRNVEGGVRQYLFYENFSRIKVSVPVKAEQKKIAGFLNKLDDKVTIEEQKLDQLKEWKKGLLQQMFV